MLFGLGEGLGFFIWKMKSMNTPFIGGRIKPDLLTQNIVKNLGLRLDVKETSSKSKAWKSVKELLDKGKAVGLKLDCYHLEYFTNPIHFAGHYVAIIGYDDKNAFLVDTAQQGGEVSSSLKSLELARNEKGSMSSKNLFYVIEKDNKPIPIKKAIITAIRNNAATYLNPPIKNLTYKGIYHASEEIIKWFDSSKTIEEDFGMTAMLMEKAGTGGALFRNLYRDFLKEAYTLTNNDNIKPAYISFVEIAKNWSEVIVLFKKISKTKERKYILKASEKMKEISVKEKEVMQLLANA
ncbi:BtrH N-terminal domain-containing protein [Treponema denticola]|uniref:BtrH N-terminal domain-containing protein n=1 Tax=Treponema denticola TaxID=158 RepID=UPI0026482C42|nr:BtrH N-terminal domain-containing protein [Treponema denticola]